MARDLIDKLRSELGESTFDFKFPFQLDNDEFIVPADRSNLASRSSVISDLIRDGQVTPTSILDIYKLLIDIHKSEELELDPENDKLLIVFDDFEIDAFNFDSNMQSNVESAFNKLNCSISIFSVSGYSFTSELVEVYKVRPAAESRYSDLITVCKRAILAIHQDIDGVSLESYASAIIKGAVLDMKFAKDSVKKLIFSMLPSITLIDDSNRFTKVKVYLGERSNGMLSFWVRVQVFLSDFIKPVDIADMKLFQASYFSVYVRHDLASDIMIALRAVSYCRLLLPRSPADTENSLDEPSINTENEVSEFDSVAVRGIGLSLSGSRLSSFRGGADDRPDIDQAAYFPSHSASTAATSHNSGGGPAAAYSTSGVTLSTPSPSAELAGWGLNSFYSLAVDDVDRPVTAPRPIAIPMSIALEKVAMIACSPRHTLLLTSLGSVFSCGDNSEGALGLNDLKSRKMFTPVQWTSQPSSRLVKVAAGSGLIGSHSLCMDEEGFVYSWGVAPLTGLDKTSPVLVPTLVDTFPLLPDPLTPVNDQTAPVNHPEEGESVNTFSSAFGVAAAPREGVEGLFAMKCRDVACGGGFSVAVLKSGHVCTWGTWSHGRLGQGPTPIIPGARGRGAQGSRLARYRLRPAYVSAVRDAVSAACGEAHALVLLKSGAVACWGQNVCGQVGTGPMRSGFLIDCVYPVLVSPFTGTQVQKMAEKEASNLVGDLMRAVSVCAGAFHSIVTDERGDVWSWGARGHACLGHSDSMLSEYWGDRVAGIFTPATSSPRVMVPFELMGWCERWSRPRRIEAVIGMEITRVTAGDSFSAFLARAGQLFLCGSGHVVPPFISSSYDDEIEERGEEKEKVEALKKEKEENTSGPSEGVALSEEEEEKKKRQVGLDKQVELLLRRSNVVSIPRRPNATWLQRISDRRIVLISGSASRLFVLLDDEYIAHSLTSNLYSLSQRGPGTDRMKRVRKAYGESDSDDGSVSSLQASDGTLPLSFFEQRGHADCMIIAGGKIFLAHRALLAHRSSELRDMIELEMPDYPSEVGGAGGRVAPTQILLPHLHVQAVKALLYFLYTDTLADDAVSDWSVLHSLVHAANELKLPRLRALCDILFLERSGGRQKGKSSASADLPPCTLARDLGSLVGESRFADVRFIAEGRAILAHRFVLEYRCEYFRAMFRSGGFGDSKRKRPDADMHTWGVIDIVVPDTFVGFLRLLVFLYTDTLPDATDGALLEDLMAADRYGIHDMKTLCESMLCPSQSNWLDLLRCAEVLDSPHLRTQCIAFLRDNFSVLTTPAAVAKVPLIFEPGPNDGENRRHGGDAGRVSDDEEEKDTMSTISDSLLQDTTLKLMSSEFPGLLHKVFGMRVEASPSSPSDLVLERQKLAVAEQAQALSKAFSTIKFPSVAVIVLFVASFLYQYVANVEVLSPYVPVINSIYIALGVGYIFYPRTRKS